MKNIHTPLRFVSLNIEREKHLDILLPFLKEQNSDVVCLQEVFERDIPRFEKELNMKGVFAIMFHWSCASDGTTEIIPMGIAILSKMPIIRTLAQYFKGDSLNLPVYIEETDDTYASALLSATLDVSGILYTIGTTHFTWSPHGEADENQRRDIKKFLEKVEGFSDGIVFSGDFNAPRGKEIFDDLAQRFTDNIPAEYETSLDPLLHRAPLAVKNLMVDGIFSTPEYSVTNVALHFGVSDHAAIVANIEKI